MLDEDFKKELERKLTSRVRSVIITGVNFYFSHPEDNNYERIRLEFQKYIYEVVDSLDLRKISDEALNQFFEEEGYI